MTEANQPTQEEEDARALAEIRRVLEIEDYERLGIVILAILERIADEEIN